MAEESIQGKLTEEEIQHAKRWIDIHRKTSHCPVCDTALWQMASTLVSPIVLSNSSAGLNTNFGGGIYPLVLIGCGNCGYVQYFNATLMGLPFSAHGKPNAETAPTPMQQQPQPQPTQEPPETEVRDAN